MGALLLALCFHYRTERRSLNKALCQRNRFRPPGEWILNGIVSPKDSSCFSSFSLYAALNVNTRKEKEKEKLYASRSSI